jgi:dolichol-phosphate mannosyltransferase
MDADLQHPPEVIPQLLSEIQRGADLAIASRYVEGASIINWGFRRRLMSRIALLAAKLLLPQVRKVRDPLSGFFLLRRQAIDGVGLNPTGYKILLEILVKGKASKVVEIPFLFTGRGRGESKLDTRQGLLYLKHACQLAGLGEGETFLKFCAVGFSGVIVNMGLLWLLTELAGLYYLVSAAFSIETSILSNFTLNELWTFRDRGEASLASILRRALRFNMVSLTALVINLAILWGLTQALGINYHISSLIGIGGATLWNFGVNNHWTWAARCPKSKG